MAVYTEIDTIMGVICYASITIGILFMYAINAVHIERVQDREQTNKEIKAQEEHNRIGFLLKLRDERKGENNHERNKSLPIQI